jgi:hypothetical protein
MEACLQSCQRKEGSLFIKQEGGQNWCGQPPRIIFKDKQFIKSLWYMIEVDLIFFANPCFLNHFIYI